MPSPTDKAREIAARALRLRAGAERDAYLAAAGGDDSALAAEIDRLISLQDESSGREAFTAIHGWAVLETTCAVGGEGSGDLIGRYKLGEPLGAGGFGTVWLAEQREPIVRRVALKVIKLGMDTKEVIARFEAERQALAMMDHPGIAKVFDAGATETGRPYFAMELVKGDPITTYCDRKKLNARDRLALFVQVCCAVQHAHQKGVIHRDLKPSNILVREDQGKAFAKVIDFGVAKAIHQPLTEKTLFTMRGQMVGTPEYMSPEQAEMGALDVDTRSDIYALGVVLYELLTGQTPIDRGRIRTAAYDELLRLIREEEPLKPSTRISGFDAESSTTIGSLRGTAPEKLGRMLRGDLDWIVMKALEKDRDRRYETANALAEDVNRFLHNEIVEASPPSVAYRTRKFVGRHRGFLGAVAAIIVVLTAGTTVSIWQAIEAHQANDSEKLQRVIAQKEAGRATTALARNNDLLVDLDLRFAQELIARGESKQALGKLARILRANPENRFVAEKILAALANERIALPRRAFHFGAKLKQAVLSADDRELWTVSDGGELRRWNAETGAELELPFEAPARCDVVECDPGGARLAVAFADATMLIVPLADQGKEAVSIDVAEAVNRMTFSADGGRLLTLHSSSRIRVWNPDTELLISTIEAHGGKNIEMAEFSPDGKRISTASTDLTARIWDAATGQAITPPLEHQRIVLSARFSPDGSKVVTASADYTAQIWDSESGDPLSKPLQHRFPLWAAEFSPDGTRVVTASNDRTARLWDARTGETIGTVMAHEALIKVARFSPDGMKVLTSGWDSALGIWDATTGERLSNIAIDNREDAFPARFTARGDLILVEASSAGGDLWLWDALPGPARPAQLFHEHMATYVLFGPQGDLVVTGTDNHASTSKSSTGPYSQTGRAARVWNTRTGTPVTAPLPHGLGVTCADFSPDRTRLATASRDGKVHIWNLASGEDLFPGMEHESGVSFLRFMAGGTKLLSFSWDGTLRIWDAGSGRLVREVFALGGSSQLSFFRAMRTADLDPSERWFASPLPGSGLDKSAVAIWDISGIEIPDPIILPGSSISGNVHFSPDGQRIVAPLSDRAAGIWETSSGREVAGPLQHDDRVNYAEFSPDGRLVVTASADRTARIWDAESGKPLGPPLKHADEVITARFSPDGLRVVTSSWDLTAQVWDVETGMPLMPPFRHDDFVHFAEFSPDGRRIATACLDGTVQLWDVPVVNSPAPPWLAELAEYVAGGNRPEALGSTSEASQTGHGSAEILFRLRSELRDSDTADPFARWVRWFLADRSTRTISPYSSITIPQYVSYLAQGRSTREPAYKEALFHERRRQRLVHALHLAPNDARVQAELALTLLEIDSREYPRGRKEADFLSRRASRLAPEDPVVRKARSEVQAIFENVRPPVE